MAVRFIIGRAGTGKTHHCFTQIVRLLREEPLGPPVYWIVPRQATFEAERMLACESGLGGYVRARVVSFDSLAEQVLAECGGGAASELTGLGRGMILGHLLRQNEKTLLFFQKVARQPGLAAKIDATLEELQRNGKEPADLEKLLQQYEEDAGIRAKGPGSETDPFCAKLHDLRLIFQSYVHFVGQERLDPALRLGALLSCISGSRDLRQASVFVDGFTDFDARQRQILARLAKVCAAVDVTLLMDPASPVLASASASIDELSIFHRAERHYQHLLGALRDAGALVAPPLLLDRTHRFKAPALWHLERSEGGMTVEGESIVLLEAPDRRSEVHAAARQILHLLSQGMRLRDIALLVRRLEDYHDLIAASFAEHGIAFFVDRRRAMAHHPLVQFLRAIMAIARGNWPHDAVMQLIKTGLAGISEREADLLENYVLEHHLRGGVWLRPEPWAWRRQLTRFSEEPEEMPDESAQAEQLRRRVCAPLKPLLALLPTPRTAVPLREIARMIFQVFEQHRVTNMLGQWIALARSAHVHEQAGEHEQVWAELVALFDQMVELLGDEPVTLDDFNDILEAGLETFDLALTPPTLDQVLVGQVDRTRTGDVKAALVLGLSEGSFPAAARDTSILSDPDRQELARRAFEVDDDSERRVLDERLLGYIAFTRASQRLYLSRPTADDKGRPAGPSIFWQSVRGLFPGLGVMQLPQDEREEVGLISTPRQLLTGLMRWARTTGNAMGENSPWPALYQWLATYPTRGDAIDNLRFRTWKALQYANAAQLGPPVAQRLFSDPLAAPIHQIETFATCAFRHFLRHGLRLERRDEREYLDINLDFAFHDVMEQLVRDMLTQETDWASLTPDTAHKLVQRYVERIGQTLHGEILLSNARNRYLVGRIEKALEEVVAMQQAMATRWAFQTAHSRVVYGDGNARLPALSIRTPRGREVRIQGYIDRVDILHEQKAFTILDYRLYGAELSLGRALHGLSLALPAHLLALQEHGQKLAGEKLSPAAAFYLRLVREIELVEHPREGLDPDDPRFPLRGAKMRGVFDSTYLPQLDGGCEPGTSSEIISARRNKGGELGNKAGSDFAEPEEFEAFLQVMRGRIGELADRILDGQIEIRPYRINTSVPCSTCGYKSVCRFDPALNRYNAITLQRRDEVLAQALRSAQS